MNLHEFCKDSQVLEWMGQLPLGSLKTKEFLAQKMGDLSIEYWEIAQNFGHHCNGSIDKKRWEQEKEDIQQKLICDKLLTCKFSFLPSRGSLKTYMATLVVRMLIDEHRHGKKQKPLPFAEKDEKNEENAIFCPRDKEFQAPLLRLKKECYREIQMQSCLRRTILKLWRPYFFDYNFEPDEARLLESHKLSLEGLKTELQRQIMEELKTDHKEITIFVGQIAQWLDMSPNAIDRHLSVLRKKLSWLRKENLKHALAEENF